MTARTPTPPLNLRALGERLAELGRAYYLAKERATHAVFGDKTVWSAAELVSPEMTEVIKASAFEHKLLWRFLAERSDEEFFWLLALMYVGRGDDDHVGRMYSYQLKVHVSREAASHSFCKTPMPEYVAAGLQKLAL